MREILFRGKPLGYLDNSFIYGSLGVISTDLVAIYQCKEFVEDEIFLVDIGTIGQYTGLRDNTRTEEHPNGKKIFEGDIVKFGDIIGVINYGFGCFCVKTHKPDWKSRNNPAIDIVFNEYPNEVEVIGNIHDNSELLKGGEG